MLNFPPQFFSFNLYVLKSKSGSHDSREYSWMSQAPVLQNAYGPVVGRIRRVIAVQSMVWVCALNLGEQLGKKMVDAPHDLSLETHGSASSIWFLPVATHHHVFNHIVIDRMFLFLLPRSYFDIYIF